MEQQEDLWHVQLESGEVRILTLDQLDAFFNNGIIDEQTYVLQDGSMDWRTLGDVLGLTEEPAAPAAAPPALRVAVAPLPVPAFESPAANPFAPNPFAASPTPAPVSYGAVPAYQPLSTRPVVSEIDADELDMDAMPFKRFNIAKVLVGGAIAATITIVAVFAASRMGHSSSSASVSAAVVRAVETPAVVVAPPPPVNPQPVVEAPKLTDDAKKALADKDTQLNQKIDARKQARLKNVAPVAHKASPPPFHKGGNAYDPLNAKL